MLLSTKLEENRQINRTLTFFIAFYLKFRRKILKFGLNRQEFKIKTFFSLPNNLQDK